MLESTGVAWQLPAGGTQRAWIWGQVRGEMRVSWRSEDKSHLFLRVGRWGPISGWPPQRRPCCLCPRPSAAHPGASLGLRSVAARGDTGLRVDKERGCPPRTLPLARRRVEPAGLLCCSWPAALAAQGNTAPGSGCKGPSSLCGVQGSAGGLRKGMDRNARERAAHSHARLLNACLPLASGA